MTDIVERLRSIAAKMDAYLPLERQQGAIPYVWAREAADEIDRLRKAVARADSELSAAIATARDAVAAERAAILDLMETIEYRPSRSTTGAVLEDIVSAIKARGTE